MADRCRRVAVAALVVLVGLAAARASAGPAIDEGTAERAAERIPKLELRARRAPPAVVPAACPVPAGEETGVSAAALIAELKKNNVRRDEVRAAEAALDAERAELALEKERMAAERLDVELMRAELTGGPLPARSDAAPAATPGGSDADQLKSLSATVKAMKADRAAAVVALLDRTLAAQVMRTLSKPAAAAIYERLSPETAAGIMQIIAQASVSEAQP